jgi:hypothetical protein
LLRKNSDGFGISGRLEKLTKTSAPPVTRFAGLEHNFAFSDADYEHDNSQHYFMSSHIPVIYQYILEPAKKAVKPNALSADLGDWLIENVLLPGDIKNEIQAAVNALRTGKKLQTPGQ